MVHRKYNEHVEEVKRHVPSEKLLVFSCKDGWEPLCRFLDVVVPEEPFPHVNDAKEFQGILNGMTMGGNIVIAVVVGLVAAACYWMF